MSVDSARPSYDPYRIDSIQEVDQLLGQLLDQGVLLRMHAGNSNQSVITTLLDLDFDNDTIIIDSAAQQTLNTQLVHAKHAYFEATLNNVPIEFQVQPLSLVSHQGRPALAGPIPDWLRRIQRRENFRIKPTIENTAQCVVRLEDTEKSFDLYDISSSGMALLVDEDLILSSQNKTTFTDAVLVLPHIGEIALEFKIVRQQTQALASGKKLQLVGCSFYNLTSRQQLQIQNYINNEQRLQIARDRGLA